LLFDFLALAFSGIMMSGFVFEWVPFSGGMITARTLKQRKRPNRYDEVGLFSGSLQRQEKRQPLMGGCMAV